MAEFAAKVANAMVEMRHDKTVHIPIVDLMFSF
jgi:hypothetical protein